MHSSSFSCRVASQILILLFLSDLIISPLYQGSLATSCGQPRLSNDDKCSSWQCSRILQVSNEAGAKTGIWSSAAGSVIDRDKIPDYGICVRGLEEGMECKVDDDCFMKQGLKCAQYGANPMNASVVPHRCEKLTSNKNIAVGYIAALISCLMFGSVFVPAKKVKPGNGILFQFIMCGSILVISIFISLVTKRYTIFPKSMLGGMLWCIGNAMAVPLINLIGIGLGMTMWTSTKLVTGWASKRFGFLGLKAAGEPNIPWLAYLGICIGLGAIGVFILVKPTLTDEKEDEDLPDNANEGEPPVNDPEVVVPNEPVNTNESEPPVNDPEVVVPNEPVNANEGEPPVNDPEVVVTNEPVNANEGEPPVNDPKDKPYNPLYVRLFGSFLALLSGFFYGVNFNPSQSLMDYYVELTLEDSANPTIQYSPDGIDYVLSASLGIFITSSFITVAFYAIRVYLPIRWYNKLPKEFFGDEVNSDVVDVEKMLCPAFLSGALWITGQTGWFVANTNLGMTVSFPLLTLGYTVVANTWAVFVFHEIRGKKNFLIMGLGFALVGFTCFSTVFANL